MERGVARTAGQDVRVLKSGSQKTDGWWLSVYILFFFFFFFLDALVVKSKVDRSDPIRSGALQHCR